jgi:hypothetical protein
MTGSYRSGCRSAVFGAQDPYERGLIGPTQN